MREASEYVTGRVPGSTLMPMTRLTAHLGELDKSRPVYVVCASGNRSAAMTDLLFASGYDAVLGHRWHDRLGPLRTAARDRCPDHPLTAPATVSAGLVRKETNMTSTPT